MTSYLIVGGSSDIAIVTAKKLLEQGFSVTCLARDESRVEELKSLGAEVVIGDALDKESVSAAIEIASQQGDGKIFWCSTPSGVISIRPPHALALDAIQ